MMEGCHAYSYETVEAPDHSLPLLVPMSEVAGRMSVQEGARFLEKPQGGNGLLLGGVPGVKPGKVLVLVEVWLVIMLLLWQQDWVLMLL